MAEDSHIYFTHGWLKPHFLHTDGSHFTYIFYIKMAQTLHIFYTMMGQTSHICYIKMAQPSHIFDTK